MKLKRSHWVASWVIVGILLCLGIVVIVWGTYHTLEGCKQNKCTFTKIQVTNPIIKVEGNKADGYTIWVDSSELDEVINKNNTTSFYLYTKDIDKAIEEYEKNKTQTNK